MSACLYSCNVKLLLSKCCQVVVKWLALPLCTNTTSYIQIKTGLGCENVHKIIICVVATCASNIAN